MPPVPRKLLRTTRMHDDILLSSSFELLNMIGTRWPRIETAAVGILFPVLISP